MPDKRWEKLLVWRLVGPRFDEHNGVDLADLAGLVELRSILVQAAKLLWKRKHDRLRIPSGAEGAVELRIKRFDDGSQAATVWFGRPDLPPPDQGELFQENSTDPADDFFDSFHSAAGFIQELLRSVAANIPPPDWVPRELLRSLFNVGRTLREGEGWRLEASRPQLEALPSPSSKDATLTESISGEDFAPIVDLRYWGGERGLEAAFWAAPPQEIEGSSAPRFPRVDQLVANSLDALSQRRAEEFTVQRQTISGEVTMVDVGALRAGEPGTLRILPDGERDSIQIEFQPEHEALVTSALSEHNNRVRLRVRGEAFLDSRGKLKRFQARKVATVRAPEADALGEALFEKLAAEDPDRLIQMLGSGKLKPTLLTFAAEIAGRELPSAQVVVSLVNLLRHDHPVVREGALYGLRRHMNAELLLVVQHLARADDSPGVRRAAEEVMGSD